MDEIHNYHFELAQFLEDQYVAGTDNRTYTAIIQSNSLRRF
jgi:hypothetical protein